MGEVKQRMNSYRQNHVLHHCAVHCLRARLQHNRLLQNHQKARKNSIINYILKYAHKCGRKKVLLPEETLLMQNLRKQESIFLLLKWSHNTAMSCCCRHTWKQNLTVPGRVYSLPEFFTTEKGAHGISCRRLLLSVSGDWYSTLSTLSHFFGAMLATGIKMILKCWELKTAKMLLLGPWLLTYSHRNQQ